MNDTLVGRRHRGALSDEVRTPPVFADALLPSACRLHRPFDTWRVMPTGLQPATPLLQGPAVGFSREIDMTDGAARSLPGLLRLSSEELVVAQEMRGAVGILDLVAAVLDCKVLQERSDAGLPPVVLPLRVQVLDLLRQHGRLRVGNIARLLGTAPESLAKSTLNPLLDGGYLEIDAGLILPGSWQPVARRLVAVELKLKNWRRALRQADNAALSADAAWVVLDATKAGPAKRSLAAFQARGVGLALLEPDGRLQPLLRPALRARTVPWLRHWLGELVWAEFHGS